MLCRLFGYSHNCTYSFYIHMRAVLLQNNVNICIPAGGGLPLYQARLFQSVSALIQAAVRPHRLPKSVKLQYLQAALGEQLCFYQNYSNKWGWNGLLLPKYIFYWFLFFLNKKNIFLLCPNNAIVIRQHKYRHW